MQQRRSAASFLWRDASGQSRCVPGCDEHAQANMRARRWSAQAQDATRGVPVLATQRIEWISLHSPAPRHQRLRLAPIHAYTHRPAAASHARVRVPSRGESRAQPAAGRRVRCQGRDLGVHKQRITARLDHNTHATVDQFLNHDVCTSCNKL